MQPKQGEVWSLNHVTKGPLVIRLLEDVGPGAVYGTLLEGETTFGGHKVEIGQDFAMLPSRVTWIKRLP